MTICYNKFMSLIILFGLPGAGKSYVGNIFKEYFGFYFYNGDRELSEKMKMAIKNKLPFTGVMRNAFFNRLINKINFLGRKHKKLVIAQTYIKEKYRQQVINSFSEAKFILIKTDDSIRELRLSQRKLVPLDREYARQMCINFEAAKIKYFTLDNDREGKKDLITQIRSLLVKMQATV